eukprot:783369-Rhodomonas_salina.6
MQRTHARQAFARQRSSGSARALCAHWSQRETLIGTQAHEGPPAEEAGSLFPSASASQTRPARCPAPGARTLPRSALAR